MKGNNINFRQEIYCEKISSRFREIYHLIECHISLLLDFALSSVFFSRCFYERQTNKPARPISWLGSCERKYCLLCREKVSWRNFEPFWRNITSKIVMSWKLLPKFRQITWFCYLCFYGRQADKPARPIGWLGSGERKYCQLKAGNVLWKNFEPFSRNISSNKMSYKLMTWFRPIKCFPLSLLLWKPGRQTSAANWLTRFMWKEILFTWRSESIMKKFRAVLEKCNI